MGSLCACEEGVRKGSAAHYQRVSWFEDHEKEEKKAIVVLCWRCLLEETEESTDRCELGG